MRALASIALLAGSPALAWEAMCRTTDLVSSSGNRVTDGKLEKAICEDEKVTNCEGMDFARGVQLGEHASLTRRAMIAAGFGEEYTDEAHVFEMPDLQSPPQVRQGYWTQGKADIDPTLDSLEPQGPRKMTVFAKREVAIPELSDLSDWSHSLAEFSLGNEHCIPQNVKRKTREDVDMCHGFREGHQGSINSNHWPPLSRAVYTRFHGLALQIARRCKTMESKRSTDPSPISARMRLMVKACQRESLAMQAYASHFLEDAHSTGHMFDRWGAPVFGPTDVDKMHGSMASIVVGTIHGARAVTHKHDRANMPGPDDPVSGGGQVQFKRAGDSALYAGGGDMYLMSCLENAPGWNVSQGEKLQPQYQRMMTCLARGFREVWEAGPDSRTPPGAETGLEQASFDSMSDACWSQRLTNRSMMLSLAVRKSLLGVNLDYDLYDFAHPGIASRTYAKISLWAQRGDRNIKLTDLQIEREKTRMRTALVTLATDYTWAGLLNPDDTDLATMTGFEERLRDVFGYDLDGGYAVPWSGHYLPELVDGGIPFYEAPTLTGWATPYDINACVDDDYCPAGYYCDKSGHNPQEPYQRMDRCVRHETGIARAMRLAETPYLCNHENWGDLQQVRANCRDAGSEFSEPCRACMQVIAPRLRNGCDPGSTFKPKAANGTDYLSICDHYQSYGTGGLQGFVHIPYDLEGASETWEQAFERTVKKACLDGPEDAGYLPLAIDYRFSLDPFDAGFPMVGPLQTRYEVTCGRGVGEQWFGWTVSNPLTSPQTWEIAMRVADGNLNDTHPVWAYLGRPDDVILEWFPAPACDRTATGTRANLVGTVQRVSWVVPASSAMQVCVRVTVKNELVRTGYQLSIGHPPAF